MRYGLFRGFTLVEILIVVAIIGILASIAFPQYSQYVRASHRVDAKSALTQAATGMERYYTERQSYVGATLGAGATDVYKATSPDSYYTIALGNQTASTYTLTATPTGSQASDTCGAFSINQAGVRTPATAGCW
jgi:type IV pilus assembly protein PilE